MTPIRVAPVRDRAQLRGIAPLFLEATARSMGTDVRVVCTGHGPDPRELLARVEQLEGLWTRFSNDSELSRLGAMAGTPVLVGPETLDLVDRCLYAWRVTGGRFDPTVIGSLEALGYDRDLAEAAGVDAAASVTVDVDSAPEGCRPAPGLADAFCDRATGLVRLPPAVRIDPGGIGKGLAADLAAVESTDEADEGFGVLVSAGGDLRTAGTTPPGGWKVELDHLVGPPVQLVLAGGEAVATSSVLGRRWSGPSGACHHVIDPTTGLPTDGPAVSVSVIAAEAWWAEVLATVILVDLGWLGRLARSDIPTEAASALVTMADGSRITVGADADRFGCPHRSDGG